MYTYEQVKKVAILIATGVTDLTSAKQLTEDTKNLPDELAKLVLMTIMATKPLKETFDSIKKL